MSLQEFIDVDPAIITEMLDSALSQIAAASTSADRRNVLVRLLKAGILMYITSTSQYNTDLLNDLLKSFQGKLGHTRTD